MNKGILCGPCNNKFSPLDDLLSSQLGFLNGVIGVRPDWADVPRLADVDSADGPLRIDHAGRPTFAEPRVVSDVPSSDGRRMVSMEFAGERQFQEWLDAQRAEGFQVQQVQRGEESQRYISEPIRVQWSLGGNKAFREIGRIALNFFAHRWPDAARSASLRPFKDWVEGTRNLSDGEPRFVWYAPADAFDLPNAAFNFGHQVLLSLDEQGAYGRVRFFSAFDLFVWFGPLPGVASEAVVYDINPLAEHPPDDVQATNLGRLVVPESITPPTTDTQNLEDFLTAKFRGLMKRVEDHQWLNATRGLLDALNATHRVSVRERRPLVQALLEPHLGRVLFLARQVAEDFRRSAHDPASLALADALESMLVPDATSPDGLSQVARASLHLGFVALVDVITNELTAGPLTDERLCALLSGGHGAHAVGRVLVEQVVRAFGG
ncbi:hypothetical protein [Corallococcus exiguus]|uniref:hypothetical protein n=1 Tax=Corallococcus exiguus TaxID=83462 RepID=UPI002016992A